MRRRLESAGNPFGLTPVEFNALKAVSLIGWTLAGIGLITITQLPAVRQLLVVVVFAIIGMLAPERWLSAKVAWRKEQVLRALPNMIDLLNVSIEAGLGFDGAIARIVERTTGPLADELRRALQEMRMGKSRTEALRAVADRTNVTELGGFVAAIYQAEELGASMTKVLRSQGDMMRSRRRARAREIAAKLPVKMLFPLIFFIFPSIFIVVLGPAVIQLSKSMVMK